MKHNDKNVEKFIEHVKEQTAEHHCEFSLRNTKYCCQDGVRCSGFFWEDPPTLICATNKPLIKWVSTLVHEYGHFLQWITVPSILEESGDSCNIFFDWLNGESGHEKAIKKHTGITRDVEADCERIAVKTIKKFNLPIDIKQYCQQANAYVYFYNYILLTRKWYKTGKGPYEVEEVYSKMPTHLKKSYDNLPEEYIGLYSQFC